MIEVAVFRRRSAAHLVLGLALLAYALVYYPTLETLVGVWGGDGTFQYAFLIAPISVFLIWSRRQEISNCDFSPSPVGLLLIIAATVLWLVGHLVGVLLFQHFAVVALLPALVLAIYGPTVGRALLFPLLYLFFAFPWPVSGVTALLQHITAEFSVRVLQLTGFTTVLQGVLIETPFGIWHVAEACSGIKFFIASLALGALYANLFYRSWRRRAVFMVFAFVVPIIANGFRVYFTVVIGEVFGVQYATGTDHLVFGWQFFGTVLLLLFLAGWHWRESPPPKSLPEETGSGAVGGRTVPHGVLAIVLLLGGPVAAWALAALTSAAPVVATSDVPRTFGAWSLLLPGANPLEARYQNPDREFTGTFADGARHVNIVRVLYRGRPRDGHKLFLSGNRPYNPGQWRSIGKPTLTRLDGMPAMRELRLASREQQRLVWYWYEVGGRVVHSLPQVKLRQLLDGLGAESQSTQVVIVSTLLSSASPDAVVAGANSLRTFMRAYMAAEHRS